MGKGTQIAIAVRATLVTLVVTGIVYPIVVTLFASLLFSERAGGSFVADEKGASIGSELIAQPFKNASYFQPRPSAAGNDGFDALASSASNLGPTSAKLRARVIADVVRLRAENPDASGGVPVELVTTSGSGLDPHLSPAGARWQIPRIAKRRGVSLDRVKTIVDDNVEGPDLGLFGEPTVNVLRLNLALDRSFGRPASSLEVTKTPTLAARSSTTSAGR